MDFSRVGSGIGAGGAMPASPVLRAQAANLQMPVSIHVACMLRRIRENGTHPALSILRTSSSAADFG